MTRKQPELGWDDDAIEKCRELYAFLDKHGKDGDRFSGVFTALDALLNRGNVEFVQNIMAHFERKS